MDVTGTMSSVCYVTIFVIILPGIIHSQQYVDDLCTLKSTGSPGVCKLLSKCQQAREELQKHQRFPQTCGFEGTQPIVCCPESPPVPQRVPGEISKKKCREYSKYYIEKKPQPILLIQAPEIEKNECGHKVVKLIVGGEPAGRKEFPHMAVIGYEEVSNDIKWLCGGTIISQQYILTAGHCLVSSQFGPAKYVRMGITNLNDRSTHKQEIRVTERIAHPEYRSSSHYNDIGLLKLQKPARMNSFSRPACLYTNNEITAEKAIATGWGNTAYAGTSSDDLLKVTLDFFTHENCNRSYKNQISRKLKRGIIDDIQICAGSLDDEEKDTCQGDSGGPLQIYHINDDIKCMYDIVGVTSFGKACSGSPGVYARISHYIKWIEDNVWPQES